MTTKVTVDAHAGWPVSVTSQRLVDGEWSDESNEIVDAHTTRDVHVWDDKRIVIQELKKDA